MAKLISCFLALMFAFGEAFGTHAIALFGTPKYPKGFSHFAYANPQAPKGGTLKSFELGDFNSLNPFAQKGNAAQSIAALVYETLGVGSLDESATEYGLIAQEFVLDPKGFFLECRLNPKARFSDGVSVSAEDVKFSFETLISLGKIQYRRYYADVKRVEVLDCYQPKHRTPPHPLPTPHFAKAYFYEQRGQYLWAKSPRYAHRKRCVCAGFLRFGAQDYSKAQSKLLGE